MEADEGFGLIMKNHAERYFEEENKMKTIGLLGGMSWESTVTYYQVINETIKEKLGGLHSAKILLYSVDLESVKLVCKKELAGNTGGNPCELCVKGRGLREFGRNKAAPRTGAKCSNMNCPASGGGKPRPGLHKGKAPGITSSERRPRKSLCNRHHMTV